MVNTTHKNKGFTLVELLTVLAIITMLVGLLVPSLTSVRRVAKETKQKAQLTAIEAALTAFRNDHGDYPPSVGWDFYAGPPGGDGLPYVGAQKLCEALLGLDLMGFHPQTTWTYDGGGPDVYDLNRVRDVNPADGVWDTLYERKGRYLELETANAFRVGTSAPGAGDGLYDIPLMNPMGEGRNPGAWRTHVLCDVFGKRKIVMPNNTIVKAGVPILYYKADTSSKILVDGADLSLRIYAAWDNKQITYLEDIADDGDYDDHPLNDPTYDAFYDYVRDQRAPDWPYRPDSYLLITAGADGIYGTGDDICNFGN